MLHNFDESSKSLYYIEKIIASITRSYLIKSRKLSPFEISFDDIIQSNFIDKFNLDSLDLINLATEVNIFFNIHIVGIEDYLLVKKDVKSWAEISLEALLRNNGLVTFSTSGTTGKPKRVTHNLVDIFNEANFIYNLVKPFEKIISYVPSHHIYGFIYTIILPYISNSEIYYYHNIKLGHITSNILIIAVPEQWKNINELLKVKHINFKGISSTGKLNNELYDELTSNGVNLFEFYGSTESLGIGYRKSEKSDFTFLPHIKFVDGSIYNTFSNKSYEIMDILEINGENFKIKGRKDGAISIGGINIFPNAVRNAILKNNDVEDCQVRAYDSDSGPQLKALIIPKVNDGFTKNSILEFIRNDDIAKIIKNIKFVDNFPRNEMGKLLDWEI
jgi:4-coumarate--CoA ligase